MTKFMLNLDALLQRRRAVVLALWALVLIAAVPFTARQSDHLTGGGYDVAGSQSRIALSRIEREFPRARTSTLAAVLVPERGATPAQLRAALARVQGATRPVPEIALTRAAKAEALRAIAARGPRPLLVPLAVAAPEDRAIDVASSVRDRLASGRGVRAYVVGQGALWAGLQVRSKDDLANAERTGFPVVALILLAVFGTLAAAALPLALGFASVGLTGALIYWLSQATEMSVFVTNMASMIGIGVAVDYSLFVLARYREEVRDGAPPAAARGRALATSGVAVAFSGATVVVSLAGLFLVHTTAIRSMALGAILVVAVSVLASATLLPALMGLLGRRAYARGRLFLTVPLVVRSWRRRRPGSSRAGARPAFWSRWTEGVMRRPVVSATLAAALLVVLALPAFGLETGDGALRQLPRGDTTRQGFEAAARLGAGAGASSPLRLVVGGSPGARELRAVRRVVARDAEVARVGAVRHSADGRTALLEAVPRHDGESVQAKALVRRLRAELPRGVAIGGASAAQVDFNHAVMGSLWKIALFVLALSYLVLLVLLRSVVLPLKAAVMNLLSVGAAYGVLVAAFQWGWFGFERVGHVDTLTPPLVLAVVFGLSMDYEVFLLTRIRERYQATGSTRRAVAEGLSTSARTITSAAAIMVAVFAVFAGTGVPAIRQLGLGCAVAIALDATVVRLVLVPAAMQLLDRWNWWLPRPLGRVLPRVGLERLPAPASGD